MTWHEAIESLEDQMAVWAPEGSQIESQAWSEDPTAKVLVITRPDLKGERRITLAPVVWKRDEVPTAADLYSVRGPRLRLEGPDASGRWRFLTNDLIPLKVDWNAQAVGEMLSVLLAA